MFFFACSTWPPSSVTWIDEIPVFMLIWMGVFSLLETYNVCHLFRSPAAVPKSVDVALPPLFKSVLSALDFAVRQLCTRHSVFVFSIAALPQAFAMDTGGAGGASWPPLFLGPRDDYAVWWMAFAGFVAWRFSSSFDILEVDKPEPAMPAFDLNPSEPGIIANQAAVTLAVTAQNNWRWRNRQLYGALLQSLPD